MEESGLSLERPGMFESDLFKKIQHQPDVTVHIELPLKQSFSILILINDELSTTFGGCCKNA